jgi:hypothetical protein
LLFVRAPDQMLFNRCNDRDTTRPQRSDQIRVHCMSVNIDFELAHVAKSRISLFKCFGRAGFRFQICFYLIPVCTIVCKRGVDLRQRKMAKLLNDLLRNESRVLVVCDSTH